MYPRGVVTEKDAGPYRAPLPSFPSSYQYVAPGAAYIATLVQSYDDHAQALE